MGFLRWLHCVRQGIQHGTNQWRLRRGYHPNSMNNRINSPDCVILKQFSSTVFCSTWWFKLKLWHLLHLFDNCTFPRLPSTWNKDKIRGKHSVFSKNEYNEYYCESVTIKNNNFSQQVDSPLSIRWISINKASHYFYWNELNTVNFTNIFIYKFL